MIKGIRETQHRLPLNGIHPSSKDVAEDATDRLCPLFAITHHPVLHIYAYTESDANTIVQFGTRAIKD